MPATQKATPLSTFSQQLNMQTIKEITTPPRKTKFLINQKKIKVIFPKTKPKQNVFHKPNPQKYHISPSTIQKTSYFLSNQAKKKKNSKRVGWEMNQTWGSRVRTISALLNLWVRRIMKQPRASSQWKLPLCVPTRFRGAWTGDPEEKESDVWFAMRRSGSVCLRKWDLINGCAVTAHMPAFLYFLPTLILLPFLYKTLFSAFCRV